MFFTTTDPGGFWTRFVNLLFLILIFLSAFHGSIFMLFPLLPFIFPSPQLWRRIVDVLTGIWLILPPALLELLHGLKVYLSNGSDSIVPNESSLMIINHRTRMDWLYLWPMLYRFNPMLMFSEKIILKSSLKTIPGAGWAMQANAFVFLERDKAKDKAILTNAVSYYSTIKKPYQILLFPEGTNMAEPTKAHSDAYAESHGLTKYKHVLHPRMTGFITVIQEMLRTSSIDSVMDITIAYPDTIVTRESELLQGRAPRSVCFKVQRYAISEIGHSEEELERWLRGRWAEKEAFLAGFYSQHPNPLHGFSLISLTCAQRAIIFICAAYWIGLSMIGSYWVLCYFWARIYAVLAVSVLVSIQHFCGGIEMMIIRVARWHGNWRRKLPSVKP